jgi:hypothetical protein
MKTLKVCFALAMLSVALSASAMARGPGPQPSADCASGLDCLEDVPATFHVCPNGTIVKLPLTCPNNATPRAIVEQPATKPAPTVAAATPPQNIACKLPFVATLRGDKWQCIVPKSTKIQAGE